VGRVVCATDAGREGELIFRYIYEAAACDKPFSRLWISSLTRTPSAGASRAFATAASTIRWPTPPAAQPRRLAGGHEPFPAYSLAYDQTLSVGRVQTPRSPFW